MDAAAFLRLPQRALFASLWRDGWWCSRMQLPGHALFHKELEEPMQGEFLSQLPKKIMLGGSSMEKSMCHDVFLYVFIFQKRVFSWYQTTKISIQATNMDTISMIMCLFFAVTCSQFQLIFQPIQLPAALDLWEPNNGILMMLLRCNAPQARLENWRINEKSCVSSPHSVLAQWEVNNGS